VVLSLPDDGADRNERAPAAIRGVGCAPEDAGCLSGRGSACSPWPDGRARELATAACYDCHSNQTRWPPQSHVAPFSWLLTRDVEQGRDKLNFSTWDEDDGEADDAADAVADGSMPPRRYVLVHPDAALSGAERQVLVDALEAMAQARGGGDRSGPGGGD
jgi:hypothetical protein